MLFDLSSLIISSLWRTEVTTPSAGVSENSSHRPPPRTSPRKSRVVSWRLFKSESITTHRRTTGLRPSLGEHASPRRVLVKMGWDSEKVNQVRWQAPNRQVQRAASVPGPCQLFWSSMIRWGAGAGELWTERVAITGTGGQKGGSALVSAQPVGAPGQNIWNSKRAQNKTRVPREIALDSIYQFANRCCGASHLP
jgi:hypothetical protein